MIQYLVSPYFPRREVASGCWYTDMEVEEDSESIFNLSISDREVM